MFSMYKQHGSLQFTYFYKVQSNKDASDMLQACKCKTFQLETFPVLYYFNSHKNILTVLTSVI